MAVNAALLPVYVTPADLAGHLGISERTLRETARAIGVGRTFGKKLIFLEGDVQTILEAAKPCHSKSSSGAKSGTTEAPLTGDDFVALQKRLTAKSPSASKRKSKAARGNVISMGRGQA